jgi:hypothetical protein
MARYNSVNSTGSVAGGASISTPASGLLTTLTGSGTVTVPNPVYYTGQTQTYYNSTGSAITLSTPSGNFVAPGFTSASSISLASSAIITLISDGTNYLTQDWLGGIGVFTALTSTGGISATGGLVTLTSSTPGTMDNVVIGGSTAKAGTFNGLTNTLGTTSLAGGSASGVFSFTANQASTAYNNGSIVVTGGVGISGDTYHNGILVVGTYGTPTTGAGWRTNTTDIYGQTAATDKVRISITSDSWFNSGGAVGVGTSAPTTNSYGTTTSSYRLNIFYAPPTNSTVDDIVRITSKYNAGSGASAAVGSGPAIVFAGGIGDNQTRDRARIVAVYEGGNTSGLAFHTQTNADTISEAVRIQNNGNVGIGTTAPNSYKLQVVGTIGSTGNIYSSTSDVRLKDIVGPIVNAIDIVKAIETFYYRNNELALSLGLQGTDLQVGISAQSALKVAPEVTAPAPLDPNYLTVMYERIVPFLIEAIKDQQKDIDVLKEKINYLEGKQ